MNYSQALIRQFMDFIPARAILTAAKLGVADHIDGDGASADAIANKIGAHSDSIHRLLRILAGAGLLNEAPDGCFSLTEAGKPLRSDAPDSVKDYAVYVHDVVYEGFVGLAGTMQSGRPAYQTAFGMPFFEHLQQDPDRAALFHAGMGNRGRVEAAAVIDAYDFTDAGIVVDVGGGNGGFLSALLAANDGVNGVLMDRAGAIEAAKSGRGGALPRCEFVEGDIFDSVHSGGDIYTLKRLLFDFADDDVIQILANCRRAIPDHGRLLIIEVLQGPANQDGLAHSMDLVFLALLGGRTRTEEEYASLLDSSGFRLNRTVPTASDLTILESVPT